MAHLNEASMKALYLYVHPDHRHSHANHQLRRRLLSAAQANDSGVSLTLHDLYHQYPDGFVHAEPERALLEAHDLLIVQHPMYWFSTPALLKEWLDRVLVSDWAFGTRYALQGKPWLHVMTTGGEAKDFDGRPGQPTVATLLSPFERTAGFCKMPWLPPVTLYAADDSSDSTLDDTVQAVMYRLQSMRGSE
jgi:glutathione-regulated potassium-efflux system ancillary protein KefG